MLSTTLHSSSTEKSTILVEEFVMIIQNKHHMENLLKKLKWEKPKFQEKFLKIIWMKLHTNTHPKNIMWLITTVITSLMKHVSSLSAKVSPKRLSIKQRIFWTLQWVNNLNPFLCKCKAPFKTLPQECSNDQILNHLNRIWFNQLYCYNIFTYL